MNTVMQGLWIGRSLSTMEKLSIRSYIENGYEYHLYAYDEVSGVPRGAVLKKAEDVLPSSKIFQYRDRKSYAGFSNYFRYKLLLEKGGWWSDVDVICLKPLDYEADYVFASEVTMYGSEVVTSGVIKAPKGSELLKMAWARCDSKDPRKLKWGETGPKLLGELVQEFRLNRYVKSAATFCPIPPHRFYEAILPGRWMEFSEQTCAVHLWNEMWRRLSIDKDEEYAPRCLYERLKNTYLTLTLPADREIHQNTI